MKFDPAIDVLFITNLIFIGYFVFNTEGTDDPETQRAFIPITLLSFWIAANLIGSVVAIVRIIWWLLS